MSKDQIVTQIVEEFDKRTEDFKGTVKKFWDDLEEKKQTDGNAFAKLEEKFEEGMKQLRAEYEGEVEELKKKIAEAEAEGSRPGLMGGAREGVKSIGEMFVESEEYEEAKQRKFARGSEPMQVKSFFGGRERKALSNTDGTQFGYMGMLIEPQELAPLTPIRQPLAIRDLMTVIPTQSDTVHYVEYLGIENVYTELNAAALTTDTVITVKSTAGFVVGAKIRISAAATPDTFVEKTISSINSGAKTITVDSALGTAFAANDPVVSTSIGMTPHGEQKPEANIRLKERSHPVGTIAHYMVAHRQTLADAPQLRGIVDQELLLGLKQAEEEQLLYGNGTSPNLQGIMNNPNIQNHGVFGGTKDANGVWRLDHVRKSITKGQLSGLPVDAGVFHPYNWEDIELAKGTDNHYVWVTVTDGGIERLWRVSVMVTTAIRSGEFLMGSFGRGGYLLDREDANVRFSDQHSDYFTRNMVAILAEERVGLALTRPQAFVKGSFA